MLSSRSLINKMKSWCRPASVRDPDQDGGKGAAGGQMPLSGNSQLRGVALAAAPNRDQGEPGAALRAGK